MNSEADSNYVIDPQVFSGTCREKYPHIESKSRDIAEKIYKRLASLPEVGWVHGNTFLPANVLCDHQGKSSFITAMAKVIESELSNQKASQ